MVIGLSFRYSFGTSLWRRVVGFDKYGEVSRWELSTVYRTHGVSL